ncbi:hypothetical protein, partial [Metamycoplasma auris]
VLTVPNSILISDIVFKGRIEQNNLQIENNVIANFKTNDDVSFYPLILHPTNVQKDYVSWYSQTLFIFKLIGRYFFDKNELYWSKFYTDFLSRNFTFIDGIDELDNFSKEFLHNRIFKVTDTLTSNFANLDENKRREFKEKIYNGNDPKQFNDFEINVLLNKLTSEKLRSTIRLFILMLSKQISSSFCFKGGLTEEHEFYLPFYLEKTIDNDLYIIKSNYFVFDKNSKKWSPKENILNRNNVFQFHNKVIQMPIIPDKISEVNISNTPLDFNTSSSHNFNYLFWSPSHTSEIAEYLSKVYWEPQKKKEDEIIIEIPMKTKAPDWRVRYSEKPSREINILQYGKTSNVIDDGTRNIFGVNLKNWDEVWNYLPKYSTRFKELLIREVAGEIVFNKAYFEKYSNVIREGFETKYHDIPPNTGRGPGGGGRGWSLFFTKEKAVFPIRYLEGRVSQKFTSVNYIFKSISDFKENISEETPKFLDITFEINEDNFILEQITIKSIFANRITVRVDGYLEKNYKLNYEDNKLISETTLII